MSDSKSDVKKSNNGAMVQHVDRTQSSSQSPNQLSEKTQNPGDLPDGRHELQEDEAYHVLGFTYPTSKKWSILCVIFAVQCSMNFNASVYANGVTLLVKKFEISEQAGRVGQCVFLVCYAFGCELWAPWSEELGRWPTLQLSLFLVNSEFSLVLLFNVEVSTFLEVSALRKGVRVHC